MTIQEAVKEAVKCGGEIVRTSAVIPESTVFTSIIPTNTYDTCLLVINDSDGTKRCCRCWNPTADDLMADDWNVLRNEFGYKR